MILSPEAELILLVLALYLHDAALLLRPDEAILSPASRRRWRVSFSSDSARLGARQLYLPNLLAVHQPLFRGSWTPEPHGASAGEDWTRLAARYRGLQPWVLAIATLLFVALPATLLLQAPMMLKLACVLALYGCILAALAWLYRQRAGLALSPRKLGSLMFECLICPPVAANLIRRLSLAVVVRQDLLEASERLLAPEDWNAARASFSARVRALLEVEEPGTARHAAAHRLLERLSTDQPGLRPG